MRIVELISVLLFAVLAVANAFLLATPIWFLPPESYLGQLAYPFTRKRDTPYG